MGAWIEIFVVDDAICSQRVAPHMGAWIEIFKYGSFFRMG